MDVILSRRLQQKAEPGCIYTLTGEPQAWAAPLERALPDFPAAKLYNSEELPIFCAKSLVPLHGHCPKVEPPAGGGFIREADSLF